MVNNLNLKIIMSYLYCPCLYVLFLNYRRAEDSISPLLTNIEEDYQISYLFLGEAANQVFRFLQKATGNHDYLYWTYGLLTAWDSSIGMLHLAE